MTDPDFESESASQLRAMAEAAGWKVALSESGHESSPELEAWLADPAHAHAWTLLQASDDWWDQNAAAPEVMAARSEALQRALDQGRKARLLSRRSAVASIGMAAAALAASSVWWRSQHEVLTTGIGEQRTVILGDGSRITMDSDTQLHVFLGSHERRMELRRGQALFDVAHDPSRPFSVAARDRIVVAHGTSFNVDLMGTAVAVTLIKGKVDVFEGIRAGLTRELEPGERLARLKPGEQFGGTAAQAGLQRTIDPENVTAWKTGQIVVDDETLEQVVIRLRRYSTGRLSVAPDAASLRVSGVFNVGDIQTFTAMVQRALPVRAEADGAGGTRLSLRPA